MSQSTPVSKVPGVSKVFIDLDLGGGEDFPPNQVYDENGETPADGYDAEYVIASMKASGSKSTAINDWALIDHEAITISVVVVHDDGRRTYAEWR